MSCAACGSGSWQVVRFVGGDEVAHETRECLDCGHTWPATVRA